MGGSENPVEKLGTSAESVATDSFFSRDRKKMLSITVKKLQTFLKHYNIRDLVERQPSAAPDSQDRTSR